MDNRALYLHVVNLYLGDNSIWYEALFGLTGHVDISTSDVLTQYGLTSKADCEKFLNLIYNADTKNNLNHLTKSELIEFILTTFPV